eukprot:Gb_18485 [translate_table: standard]
MSVLLLIAAVFVSTVSAQGCYWTGTCQSRWIGGCGSGLIAVDQSDDCHGLCPEPQYPSCLPFYTHFQCCKEETPKAIDACSKCENKIDLGDEYVCCTDCSDPSITNKDTKLGYCRTGAQLAIQFKPQEVFMWVAGPWMECSSPCDGGIRYRDVSCFAILEDSPVKNYAVDDSKCLFVEMPARQETCNMQSCTERTVDDSKHYKRRGMSAWALTLLILLSMATISGLAYGGYNLYNRQTSAEHGFVYVMLEGYS